MGGEPRGADAGKGKAASRGGTRVPRKVVQGSLVGLAGAILALALWLPGALEKFEARTWDLRAQLFARPGKARPDIALILLDQKSLEWGQKENGLSWPWPRELKAAVADFCRRGGAKALVIDVLYTEPSVYGVSDDESFGRAVSENGRVVGAMFPGDGTQAHWPAEVPEPALQIAGLEQWIAEARPRRLAFTVASFPIPELSGAARVLANTNMASDSDKIYRRVPLFVTFEGRVVPSEALAAWLVGNPGRHELSVRPGALTVDGRAIPIDSDGNAILRFRGPTKTHANYSMAAIVQAEQRIREGGTLTIDPAELRGKYVFLGYSAPGLFDLKPTPMPGAYPGVEINATMLDNLLSGDFMRAAPLAAGIILLLALCVGAGIAVSSLSRVGWSVPVYVLFLALAPGLGVAAYAAGYWLQMVVLELGAVVSLVGGSLVNYATEGRQKRFIKGAFKQYLSPAVIEQIIAHPERLKLGGERRELSIFFSDLQGFTTLSEALTPEDLTALLNEYLSAMTDIIQEEGGTIDKYEGDAIIAFWNAPLELADHAVRAVRAALRCQARLAEMRPGFRARVNKDLFMRIGMNSGPAVVGNMGSRTRFDYTMLGDAVNLAARLEGINKQFHTYTMASGATVERMAGAFPARELSRVAVVGRREPVTVYEPMMAEEFAARAKALAVFAEGLARYYAGSFEEAGRIFSSIAAEDPAAGAYAEKCAELAAAAPPEGWNGVWVMTTK
jgi:adenylate cyclase